MRYGNKTAIWSHNSITKSYFWDIQVMGRNGIGRNSYGLKWSWAEMTSDPHIDEAVFRESKQIENITEPGDLFILEYVY